MDKYFLGSHTHTIDSQRRIAIPKDWRNKPGTNELLFFLLPGRNRTIQVFPKEVFDSEIVEKIKKVSFANSEKIRALARIGEKACQSNCDKQGRITLSQDLIDHAGLKDQATLIGSITSIRITTAEAWAKDAMDPEKVLDEIKKIQENG